MRILGVNAIFHDPAAALVVDGQIVAAAEEERFTRRKHGHEPVPFAGWEMPRQAAEFCLRAGGLRPEDLDAVAYSYDPSLAPVPANDVQAGVWEGLRTLYAQRAAGFLATSLPGLDPERVHHVPHHMAHAASACFAAPYATSAVLVLDGRGERASHLAAQRVDGHMECLASQQLPHSLGLTYESLTAFLGFKRASDEYKVMALAAYGEPRWLTRFREAIRATPDGGFVSEPLAWADFAPPVARGDEAQFMQAHADLAATMQKRLEEVLLDLARWLHERTGERDLCMAGGVALNCVANARIAEEGPFDRVWVQPAAGDAGTALGAALLLTAPHGVAPMRSAALGPEWSDAELEETLRTARLPYERPDDVADTAAEILAQDGVVAWFQGRSEFGPRALGHRSLLAHPGHARNVQRLNDVKGREQFRPVAPMTLLERAAQIFDGQLPSPYMLFTHRVREEWRERIPAALHVDGSARAQTVDERDEPLVTRLLRRFEARTGLPVLINTSLNTAGRPMVDSPRDALECFGSAPIDALVLGPFILRRAPSGRMG